MQKTGEKDLTEGSVWRQVLSYAMPLVFSSLLQALYSMVDTIIVGHYVGASGISAINNSGQIVNLITKIIIGLTTGGNIVVGQYFGSKNRRSMDEASGTLFTFSMVCSVVTAAALLACAQPLLSVLGAPSMADAMAYLQISAIGLVFVFGYNALTAVLRGVGNSKAPMLIIAIATLVNIPLDILFVGGFRMGTAGAAWATVCAQALSFGLALFIAVRKTQVLSLKPAFLKIRKKALALILRLGIPSALQMTIAGFSWLVVTFLVNTYGVDVSAGNGVAMKIKDLCQLFIAAMASGATTMIAQNLGAKKYDRAKTVMYTTMKITCILTVAMILLVELFAPAMAGIFTSETAVINAAVLNLRIEILGQIFYAIFMVYHALAIGAGHSTFAMLSSFANCIVFRVVLSVTLNYFFGIYGLYAACAIAPSISVPLGMWYTRSGLWRRSLADTVK